MIDEEEVLKVTVHGLNIYSHILSSYYPDELVLHVHGRQCDPAKNPFNHDRPTLKLCQEEEVFFYHDLELESFKGNPLDFAALHFGLTGQPLLEKLVREMYLVVGQHKAIWPPIPGKVPMKFWDDNFPRFSYFKAPISNIYPGPDITILEAFRAITGKRYEYITRELRLINSHEMSRKYKARYFDYVTFSGTFEKRGDKFLKKHSGMMTLDFDHVTDLPALKAALLEDEYFETMLLFTSPSGDGIKWIVPIDLKVRSHLEWFNSLYDYIKKHYGLEIDPSGKDVSRACFLPWDAEAYIHPEYRW